ncbi:MAG: hypothetical protein ACR2JC_16810 [Chloroflexota bacterium]|nr:MAG: hypothetical protein DLM70_19060 [Chloroflexota bacterium]
MIHRRPAYSAAFAQDSLQILPTGLPAGEITAAWAWEGSTGKGVKVAIIDSGIENRHPGLPGSPVAGYVAITADADEALVYDTSPHGDVFGHGSELSQSLPRLAVLVGVPEVTLVPHLSLLNCASTKYHTLQKVDRDLLSAVFERHCADLMREFFPDVTLGSFLERPSGPGHAQGGRRNTDRTQTGDPPAGVIDEVSRTA